MKKVSLAASNEKTKVPAKTKVKKPSITKVNFAVMYRGKSTM